MSEVKLTLKKNLDTILQVGFWLTYFAMLTWRNSDYDSFNNALLHTVQIIVPQILVFYINMSVLMPFLLEKKKYLLYILSVIILLLVMIFIAKTLENYFNICPDKIWRRSKKLINKRGFPPTKKFFLHAKAIISFTGFSIFLLLSTLMRYIQQEVKKEKEKVLLQKETIETELKFLRSQVNPHFLFNAMNNLYSLSVLGSEKTPDLILKLSDMLRYMLYETAHTVPLNKELEYVKHYIAFQKLKTEEALNIDLNIDESKGYFPIAPLILIPFIENAFKHSQIENTAKGWIKINIAYNESQLLIEIENSIPIKEATKDKTGGIGLENVKKRLELLYKNEHSLFIQKTENTFSIKLILDRLKEPLN